MRIGWGVVGAAWLTFVASSAANAQVFQPGATVDTRPQVQLSIDTLYDTNVARSDASLAAARGLKRQDWTYSPELSVDITRPLGPESVFLVGDLGYDFYQTNTILNRDHYDVKGGGAGQFGPCNTTLSGAADSHQSYLQDITVATPLVRNTQDLDTVSLDGGCSRPIGFGVEGSVAQSWATNSSLQFRTSDYSQLTTTGSLVYQRPNFGKLSFFGQYDASNYPNQLVLTTSVMTNRYTLYAGGVRFERNLGARLAATISLAYTSLTPLVGPHFAGFTYSGDVTYRISGRLGVHLSAIRAAQPAVLSNASYLVQQTYLGEGTYSLGSRVSLAAGVSEQLRNYAGAPVVLTSEITNDRLLDYYSTARVGLGRRLYVGLDARYDVRRGNVAELNYNDARVGLTLGAKF